MLTIDKLSEMNEWWKTNSVRKELAPDYKRKLFHEITDYIKVKQIVAVIGVRRTGKSTLFYQLITKLLKENINPKNILYLSFDEQIEDLKEVIEIYRENILKNDFREERVYIFLDEIQKLKDWQNKIKIYYDLYPKIKFFISGSASINILIPSKESLAGRVFYFNLDPLSFEEFLELRRKDIKKIKENINLWKSELKTEINNYLLKPFPEIVNLNDELSKKYIKESIIEKAIFRDLSSLFEIKDIEFIEKIVNIIAQNPGMIINLDDLSKDLNKSRQVISNYLYYLECCFILKSLRNFRGSIRASSRKLKKYYLIHPCISLALTSADKGKIIENLIQFTSKSTHFWREKSKEVDFIKIKNKKIIPVESKYSKEVRMKDLRGLIKFMEKFKINEGKVITEDYEKVEKINNKKIKFIPLWKWLLEDERRRF